MARRKFSFFIKTKMFIEAVLVLPLLNIVSRTIPYRFIYLFSKKIGFMIYCLLKKQREVIKNNLKIIFPHKNYTSEELVEIGSIICGYQIRIILEMIALTSMTFQERISYIRVDDANVISSVYKEKNKGFIGFTLHYGNWEFLGSFMNDIGMPLGCLVERQFNPFIDWYLQYLRKKMGIVTIYNEISQMRSLFKYIKEGGSVALVADQTHWFNPIFIPFFGKEAAVPQGAANLALKTNSHLFFGYTKYIEEGKYNITIDLSFDDFSSDKKEENVENLMKIIYHKYEKLIVEDVSNWYSLGFPRWELTKASLEKWKENPDSDQF